MGGIRTYITLALVGWIALAVTASEARAGSGLTTSQHAEFKRLVYQRNNLYGELRSLAKQAGSPASTAAEVKGLQGEMKWTQNQLDVIEKRLMEVATNHDLTIPRRTIRTDRSNRDIAGPINPPTSRWLTQTQRVEVSTLVHERNRLHVELEALDHQATELIKTGRSAVIVHARQVSVQDRLDLVQLRLAILSTRWEIRIPPLPEVPSANVTTVKNDTPRRGRDRAFGRGHQRAMSQLRRDADEFVTSLDFWAFLNN